MPSTSPPDPLLKRLGAIEQRLQAIEHAQRNAVLTITRQLEAFIPGPPKSVSTGCWRSQTALALVGGNGSPPCPKSQTPQLIILIPAT